MRQLFALTLIVLAACGSPSREDGPDANPADECSGNAVRCFNNAYQVCDDGTYITEETCAGSSPTCSEALGGCVECDPSGGGNTCSGDQVVTCNADGTVGTVIETCAAGSECQNGACMRACTADGVDLIYVVDEQYNLLSFDPRLIGTGNEFRLIGSLVSACQPQKGNVPGWGGIGITPFSMAVDRTATAWVLYTSGEIFKVSTQDASCNITPYIAEQAQMYLFGMGFVSDAPGSDTEHLFIGGGDPSAMTNGRLGIVDPNTYGLSLLGNITASSELSPELTGTGAAELWAFYPGISRAFVQQIDKASGAPSGAELAIPGGLGGTVTAWAFAQWGGVMYIFVTTDDGLGEVSTVRAIDRANGNYSVPLPNIPYKIVGAGVSTCAPVVVE